jgi:hypothetical protein
LVLRRSFGRGRVVLCLCLCLLGRRLALVPQLDGLGSLPLRPPKPRSTVDLGGCSAASIGEMPSDLG